MPARCTPIAKIHRMAAMLASEMPPSISYMVKALKLGRTTIREYRLRIDELGYSFKEFASLPNNEMERVLRHESKIRDLPDRCAELLSTFQKINGCIRGGHSNIKAMWAEYRQTNPDGYGYSQFTATFRSWQKTQGDGDIPSNKCAVAQISEEDVAVLNKWRRSNNRLLWSKAVTILDSYKGATVASICSKLEKGHRSIDRWIKMFCEKGLNGISSPSFRNMSTEMRDGIKNKRDRIVEILHESPPLHGINRASWSLATLSQAYGKLYGEPIGSSTISEYIRAEGYSFRKARRQLTSPDPDYREKLAVITNILSCMSEDEKFFSIDEFGPFSVKMRGGRAYTPKGTIRVIPQRQRSRGSLILTGALELSTNQMTHFYSEKKNTDEMVRLLETLLVQYPDQRCLYLSWDAASWHISSKLAKRVKDVNATAATSVKRLPTVTLAPLPSSAQFLNVIESVFSGMAKAVLHNSDYPTVDECKVAIDNYITDRNANFKQHPSRAGDKIWGEERVVPSFKPTNNCKNPNWR